MKKLLLCCLMALLLVGCSQQGGTTNGLNKGEITTTKEEVGLGLVRVESSDILEMFENKESFVVYLGTSYCSHCQQYKPHLEEEFLPDHPKATIYYVILDESDEEATKTLSDLVVLEYTPTTFLVLKGEIMDSYVGSENDELLEKMLNSLRK